MLDILSCQIVPYFPLPLFSWKEKNITPIQVIGLGWLKLFDDDPEMKRFKEFWAHLTIVKITFRALFLFQFWFDAFYFLNFFRTQFLNFVNLNDVNI